MSAVRSQGLLLQFASVTAGAVSAVLAKTFFATFTATDFLLVFSGTSAIMCVAFVDRASIRTFIASRSGLLAIATNALALGAYYYGLAGLHPSTHAFVSRTQVVFGFVFAVWMFQEPFDRLRLTLAVLCTISAALTAIPSQASLDSGLALGATLLAAALYAWNLALLRSACGSVSPATPVFLYNAVLFPLMAASADWHALAVIDGHEITIAALSTACAVLSLYWYVASAHHVSFFAATAIRATTPVLVLCLSLPWYPLEFTVHTLIGMASMPILLVGIAMSERNARSRLPPQAERDTQAI